MPRYSITYEFESEEPRDKTEEFATAVAADVHEFNLKPGEEFILQGVQEINADPPVKEG